MLLSGTPASRALFVYRYLFVTSVCSFVAMAGLTRGPCRTRVTTVICTNNILMSRARRIIECTGPEVGAERSLKVGLATGRSSSCNLYMRDNHATTEHTHRRSEQDAKQDAK